MYGLRFVQNRPPGAGRFYHVGFPLLTTVELNAPIYDQNIIVFNLKIIYS